jgi:uncharacterized protein
MAEQAFLTARWTNLVLLNFRVPADLIARLAPDGTEPDLHEGQAYISIVGFRFDRVRVFGIPIPLHASFDEVNLRYYVRRVVAGETRHGVVFVREIAARRAVALIANRLYHEHYVVCPMRSSHSISNSQLDTSDRVEYSWRNCSSPTRGRRHRPQLPARWNCVAARVGARVAAPAPNSLEEFIIEHYWAYTHGRDGRTREYRVVHRPWRVAPTTNVTWDCDVASNYAGPFAEYLSAPPAHTMIADGSYVEVFRGRCVAEGCRLMADSG